MMIVWYAGPPDPEDETAAGRLLPCHPAIYQSILPRPFVQ